MGYFNNNFFGVAATLISLVATVPYVRSILKGETRPSGASWWTWTLLTGITVISSRFAGAPWPVLIFPIWLFFLQLVISFLSISRGDNNWDVLNKICVVGAVAGIVLWLITGQPLVALLFSILADLLASIPNFRHVWTNPEQENRLAWTLGWFSAVLEMFTISAWTAAESSWAIYFLLNMSATLLLVWRPVLTKRAKS